MNRVFSILVVIVLIIACASPVFADPITLTAVDVFQGLFATYLASRGLSIVASDNYTAYSPTNPIPNSTVGNMFNLIYDAANGRLPATDQMTIDDWADWAETKVSTNVAPAGNLSPTNTTFMLADDLVEWFDKITNDIFQTDLGLASDSGVYHTSGNFFDNTLVSISTSGTFSLPVTTSDPTDVRTNGVEYGYYSGRGAYISSSSAADVTAGYYISGNNVHCVFKTITPNITVYVYRTGYSVNTHFVALNQTGNGYYYNMQTYSVNIFEPYLPEYDSLDDFLSAVPAPASNTRIQLKPEDKYNEKLKDKNGNVLSPGDIYIPDTDAQDYTPDAITGTWDIPYTDEFVNDIEKAIEKVKELIDTNQDILEIVDDNPAPVINPYVPFTNIPSFNFNFSGIWHYVTSWVSSLGSGLGFFSSIWSNLPYAMVVPIYAAAVIVIVTSVFKRFV